MIECGVMRRVISYIGWSACLALLMVCAAGEASAHAWGFSIERRVGDYLIDVGYDVPQLTKDVPVLFSFTLVERPGTLDWDFVRYDAVELEIVPPRGEHVTDRIDVNPPLVAGFPYTFEEAGIHDMHIRYLSGAMVLAEADFAVPVQSRVASVTSLLIVTIPLIGFVIGAIVIVVTVRRTKHLLPPKP